MHSYIITNLKFEISNTEDTLAIEPDPPSGGSIGIEEVRAIQKFLSRKPLGESNKVYIKNAHLLTIPAQNALLKTLEEPPGSSLIYLITNTPDLLLPTVLSRVQIIDSQEPSPQIDIEGISEIFSRITKSEKSNKILIVDELNFTREQALEFLDKLEYWLHQNLQKVNYSVISQARKYLKANVNVKLIMDNLFFNLVN
jgi:DNA polymerase III delta prime subunit